MWCVLRGRPRCFRRGWGSAVAVEFDARVAPWVAQCLVRYDARLSKRLVKPWPRVESNHRSQIRSLPLYPLSYGASGAQYARGALRGQLVERAGRFAAFDAGSVRRRSYPRAMTLGIVVFGAAFLAGLGLGTYTRRPLSTAFLVLGSFTALLVLTATGELLNAAAVLAIVALLGLVAESMRETFARLVDGY